MSEAKPQIGSTLGNKVDGFDPRNVARLSFDYRGEGIAAIDVGLMSASELLFGSAFAAASTLMKTRVTAPVLSVMNWKALK